jgi:hypothetical protein
MHKLAVYPSGSVMAGYVKRNTPNENMFRNTDTDIEISRRLLGNDSAATANAAGPRKCQNGFDLQE